MNRGGWQATVHGVTRVGHDLAIKPPPPPPQDSLMLLLPAFCLYLLRKRWQPICSIILVIQECYEMELYNLEALGLAFFTQHIALKIYLSCCMHQYLFFVLLGSIPWYGYTIGFLFFNSPIKYVWIMYTFWLL